MGNSTPMFGLANTGGASSYLATGAPLGLTNVGTQFTIGCWCRPPSYATHRPLMTRISTATVNYATVILAATGNLLGYFTVGGVAKIVTSSGTVPTTGSLAFCVFTYDGITQRLYINGVADGTNAETGVPAAIGAGPGHVIGVYNNGGDFQQFAGPVAHAFIMDRTLTAGDVRFLYEHPEGLTDPAEPEIPLEPGVGPPNPGGQGYAFGLPDGVHSGLIQGRAQVLAPTRLPTHGPLDGGYN